jgi:hypothetical protein
MITCWKRRSERETASGELNYFDLKNALLAVSRSQSFCERETASRKLNNLDSESTFLACCFALAPRPLEDLTYGRRLSPDLDRVRLLAPQ